MLVPLFSGSSRSIPPLYSLFQDMVGLPPILRPLMLTDWPESETLVGMPTGIKRDAILVVGYKIIVIPFYILVGLVSLM